MPILFWVISGIIQSISFNCNCRLGPAPSHTIKSKLLHGTHSWPAAQASLFLMLDRCWGVHKISHGEVMWQNEMKSPNQIKLNVNTMGFQWLKSGKVNACLLHFAKLLRHVKSCEHIVLRLEQWLGSFKMFTYLMDKWKSCSLHSDSYFETNLIIVMLTVVFVYIE